MAEPSNVEHTGKRDPLLHLAAMWPRPGQDAGEAIGNYVTGMEAAGQQQLVNSDRIPTENNVGSDDDLRALGFTLGGPDPDDPLFRPCTLPEGWRREGTDHAMWSAIVDERGIERVAIFYKAAFYDRRAHLSVRNVGQAVASKAIYGDQPVEPPWDKLTPVELADLRAEAEAYLAKAAEYPDIYDRAHRARRLLEQVP